MVKNPWLRKITTITHRYGKAATEYFIEHYKCEDCGDERIAILNIHHTHGKKVDKFKTLCYNCHQLEHATYPEYTYESYVKYSKLKAKRILQQKLKAKLLAVYGKHFIENKGYSLRKAARKLGITHTTLKNYLEKGG